MTCLQSLRRPKCPCMQADICNNTRLDHLYYGSNGCHFQLYLHVFSNILAQMVLSQCPQCTINIRGNCYNERYYSLSGRQKFFLMQLLQQCVVYLPLLANYSCFLPQRNPIWEIFPIENYLSTIISFFHQLASNSCIKAFVFLLSDKSHDCHCVNYSILYTYYTHSNNFYRANKIQLINLLQSHD